MQDISKHKKIFSKGDGAVKTRLTKYFKIILAFAVCLIFLLSNFIVPNVTAFADEAQSNNRTVKACVFQFEGYHMKDDDGRLTGYGIEFLNFVSKYSRLNFQYTGFEAKWNWDQDLDNDGDIDESILGMLNNHEIDVVTSVSRTATREDQCDFSLPIGRKKTVLSIRFEDTQHRRGDYKTYNGIKVGLLEGNKDSQNKVFDEFAKDKGFEYTTPKNADGTIKYYQTDNELAAALQSKDVDAILSSDLRKAEDEKTLDIIDEADFYAVVRKGDTELLDEINYAIGQMDINEGDWQNELLYKYYGPIYSAAPSFTEREIEFINAVQKGEKHITVTALGDRAPYSYAENGKLKGIMPDYFAELMKLAGLSYDVVVPTDKEHYNNLVDTNGVNVVIDSISTDEIKENAVYRGFNTDSYMTASMARVTREDFSSPVHNVAVCDSQGRNVLESRYPNGGYNFVPYATGEEAMRAVLNREADVAYVYAYTAQLFVNHDTTNSLYYSIVDGMSTTFSIHVSDSTDHELVTILNKCIKRISDDTLNQLASQYTSYTIGDLSIGEYMKAHPAIIIVIVLIFAIIVCVILGLYLRGRWNRKMLRATEQSNKKMSEQLAIVRALSRDYINVFAVNEERATARIIKLEGYVTEGLQKDSTTEYDYAVIVERFINDRVHPEEREELIRVLSLDNVKEKLATVGEFLGSYRVVEDGEIHHYQYTFRKIANNNQEQDGFILVGFRNIDEIIRKEQEQKDALAEALAQAQYASKAKTTFLNNMSHDIRTPMNAIIGFTSLAVSHLDNKEQIRNYLGKIMTSGNHLLSLINDVLDMSRIESGKVKIEEKENSLPEIIHDLKTIVQSDMKARQLEFFIDTLDVTNETIICDKLRLNQVLLNLLSNAMKYTKAGGTVSFRVAQSAEAPKGCATYEFNVKDTGIGMSSEFLKHVFEPFEREQTTTVSGIQGTGLGLAITKNIVDMMNGKITVQSEEGKGSEFNVTFTFKVADAPVEEQKLEQLENIHALVVDDDVHSCVSVSKMLSTIGMRPDWTTLGKEAVIRTQFALEQNEPYGAYFIDWMMPDMNGIELVRRLRKVIGKETPVIMLTAYDWADIEAEAREAGVTAFCSKPLFLSELRKVLAAPYMKKDAVEKPEEPELRFDGKRLLLVEDNELNMEIAQTILETVGFAIDTADDGSVAVERVKALPAGEKYDIILMDVQMPIMNGYQATRAIRALEDPVKAATPIVAMTANVFEEDRKEAIECGMNGYAAKPIELDKLMKTLENLLK